MNHLPMKTLYALILVLLAGTAYGQSNLPACQGSDVSKWSNCFGTVNFPNDRYIGEWINGKANGQGLHNYLANSPHKGDKYVGEFKDNKHNGQGTYTFANGDTYVGEWKDGQTNGQGTSTLANGEKYVGEWKDGKSHGQGTVTFANGDKYVGELKDNKRTGQGTFYFLADNEFKGDKYVGEFKDNYFNGQGNYTKVNGNKYVGEFMDGKVNGQATHTWADGNKHVGEFKDNKPNGQGINYSADGSVKQSGIYKDNVLVTSKYIDPNSFTRIPLSNAIKDTSDNLKSAKSITFDVAKLKCEELGFKPETEGFGKCVLQLTK